MANLNSPLEKRILLPEDLKPVESLGAYVAKGGLEGLKKARGMKPEEVIALVKKAKLRGRGGAGFPAAVKWEGVRGDPCPTKYLVCNGSEGEPGTYKDRYLLSKTPYPLIEGILIASYAIGVKAAFIGIKKKFTRQIQSMTRAIHEMEKADLMPNGFITVVPGPDSYLFGEEKALLEVIDGGDAMPRNMPPYIQGVRFTPTSHNPTVVNNIETLSHVPNILAKGEQWFRSIGSQDTPGTMIFTLLGDIKNPGMYELPLGLKLRDLLDTIGGGPPGQYPIKAVFSGVANRAITPDQFDTPLDFGSLRAAGSGLGSGGFIVYDESACIVKLALLFSGFLASESCGQCIPCNMGLRLITGYLKRIEDGLGTQDDIDNIFNECAKVTNQARCFLPTEGQILITSMIQKFPKEFEAHLGKPCPSKRDIPLPQIAYFNETDRNFELAPQKKWWFDSALQNA